jgi:UDP-N-acetylglucosamine--N-acetylmuramyl-(pentapeptide) pyrophosphoryl-undecaprenol N-acetylglucosamine transferase
MESEILGRHGYRTASIPVEGVKGKGIGGGLWSLVGMSRSLGQCVSILKRFSPQVVLGVGGYASGPFCAAASLLGVPTAVHEQNAYPGLTNRLLGRIVDRVFISFEESRAHFSKKGVYLTGNPVRKNLFSPAQRCGEPVEPFRILVLGGSQGAKAVNEAFVEALALLHRAGRFPAVMHQAGEAHASGLQALYRERGLQGEVIGFIEDMAAAYRFADLVVSRAGASTIFELAATGRPAILIPYPHAANRHQEMNAMALVRSGAADMVRQDSLTAGVLAQRIEAYMDDPKPLKAMGERAREMAREHAAEQIVDLLTEMVEG